ncbi:MAG: molybdenum-pterin-binding protein MopA [Pseudomonadota bacterium]
MKHPHAHIRIDFPEGCSIGPGKIALLEAVERTGSLSAAARAMGLSYRRAWLLLHSVNDSFADPSVQLSTGGRDGGGSRLTPFGKALIKAYRQFEKSADALAARHFSAMRARREAGPATAPIRRPLRRSTPRRPASTR